MSIIRPNNINRRLVGIQTQSPGNAGQIGPSKRPYCPQVALCVLPTPGQQCFGRGGCGGIFKVTESLCGVKCCCRFTCTNLGGRLLCCQLGSPNNTLWVVAPSSSEVVRNWYCRFDATTRAQQVSGCTGWFVPGSGSLQNPGYSCRTHWDSLSASVYWGSVNDYFGCGTGINMSNNTVVFAPFANTNRVRAFRCCSVPF